MEIDIARTILLTQYCQNAWVKAVVTSGSDVLDRIAKVQEGARQAGIEVIHVGIAFPEGYPAVGPLSNHHELTLKARGLGIIGAVGAQIHPTVTPRPGEVVFMSQCSGPLIGTPLEQTLRGRDIRTLVVTGIATSGSIKNIVTDGTNRFFDVVVLTDCCEDSDPETDRVLKERVFPQVCRVATSGGFLAALAQLPAGH